jgi:methyl-accepting chemotaxis protein
MDKSSQEKNLDPAVAAYVNRIADDIAVQLKVFENLIVETRKEMGELRVDINQMKVGVHTASNSIDAMAEQARHLIDKKLYASSHLNDEFKNEITKIVTTYADQVANFQICVDEMTSKVDRYFQKEKYAITKAMIAEVLREEKING